ncbi:hypothetical protein L6452_04941 [Arctium lappa]|uniref:Uncharacterized protein n=1 Tax=Arctium lappa TaxID=4217 RepID=A0ACB9EEL9_ARCLA|nr:hypothetical protein L6452_04941 [Arctium lappa]
MHAADLGDHIGMESCVDLETDTAPPPTSAGGGAPVYRKPWGISRRSSLCGKKGKELPPPMPIQSSTVMKRYYTDDGRLIITEEKVECPKYYFTAHRSCGRLTLQLVASESDCAVENKCGLSENGEGDGILANDECGDKVAAIGGGGCDDDSGNRGGGGGKCFSYNSAARVAAIGSCLFVNQNCRLHAMRPVQI